MIVEGQHPLQGLDTEMPDELEVPPDPVGRLRPAEAAGQTPVGEGDGKPTPAPDCTS